MAKDERLNVLVSAEEKSKFQEASDILRKIDGLSDLSAFVRAACHRMANDVFAKFGDAPDNET